MAADRHGQPDGRVDVGVWLADPGLALVTADLDAWLDAHPCDCDALCACDDEKGRP
jgi:hypothetical protein